MAELDVELPKAVIKRIVKAKLAEKQPACDGPEDLKREFQVNKDALSAFSQATKVFITYITAAAHDICRENKRSTVAAQDIMKALEELEFEAFLPNLQELLSDIQNKRRAMRDDGLPPRKVGRPSNQAQLARLAASQQAEAAAAAAAEADANEDTDAEPMETTDGAPQDAPQANVPSLFQ